MKVTKIKDETAIVEYGGVKYEANISLIERIKPGDYLIIHAGFAIQKLDEKEAIETLKLFKEIEKISNAY